MGPRLGFGLTPQVFTAGTQDEAKLCDKVPSTSSKTHLPYFLDVGGPAQKFVEKFIELAKAQKMMDGFVQSFPRYCKKGEMEPGDNEPPTKIISQFNFKTNTKRTQSQSPNMQNAPKSGTFSKKFRRCLRASTGKMLVASDLNQAELRIAAWMANEPTMLDIYRREGDIHFSTAAMVLRITEDEFAACESAYMKKHRQNAKPTLDGMLQLKSWEIF